MAFPRKDTSSSSMGLKTVDLLPSEELLRLILLDCRNHILSTHDLNGLDIRFTGGWVRDKLLGAQSNDIDIALSTMTGVQFGTALENYFNRNIAKYASKAQEIGIPPIFSRLHKIDRKPEKSKHLETGTACVLGLSVDFVNLRKEIYTETSRNPQVEFGTPAEDAFRRDATVNAIFYNVVSQKIEDYTEQGLEDLAAGILRTPLDPYQTFMDDPLRVLRLIRFANTLGFKIDDEAQQSIRDPMVHAALRSKISRERVAIEVEKMMKGPDPKVAFELIFSTNLYSTVFLNPSDHLHQKLVHIFPPSDPDEPWPWQWPRGFRFLADLVKETSSNLWSGLIRGEQNNHVWMLAAWTPLAPLRDEHIDDAVRNATEAMALPTNLTKLLRSSLKNMDHIIEVVDRVSADLNHALNDLPRSMVGNAIRSWGVTWKLQVLYALLAKAVYQSDKDVPFSDQAERYSKFIEYVSQKELEDASLVKPILTGADLLRIFNIKKSGPFMKVALDELVSWKFDHENASQDEAIEWLLTQKVNFDIPSG